MIGPTQRRLLTWLADNGPIDSDSGHAGAFLAAATGVSVTHASNTARGLANAGLLERDVDNKRTFHLAITHAGREALLIRDCWTQVRSTAVRRPPPPMPVCGPIGHQPFNPESVRDGAMAGAFR